MAGALVRYCRACGRYMRRPEARASARTMSVLHVRDGLCEVCVASGPSVAPADRELSAEERLAARAVTRGVAADVRGEVLAMLGLAAS